MVEVMSLTTGPTKPTKVIVRSEGSIDRAHETYENQYYRSAGLVDRANEINESLQSTHAVH